MLQLMKRKRHHRLAAIVFVLLLVCTLTVTAFAADDLSSTIGITGLLANSSGTADWTASAGGAKWEATTVSSGGCSSTYTAYNGMLEFTNNSGSTLVLSFDYELSLNGGSFTIADIDKTSNGSYSATLTNGASIKLVANSSATAANTTKVTLSNIKLAAEDVKLTFAPATNGSYTLNSTAVTANTEVSNPNTTTYKLVATPADNYHFAGWYLGETKVSENAAENAIAFATSGTITAKFVIDPLYSMATASGNYSKDQLVGINSRFFHDSTTVKNADEDCESGGRHGQAPYTYSSHYTLVSANKKKGYCDIQIIPSAVWNEAMSISGSGTAGSDYMSNGAEEAYCQARVVSDVIQIYAKENCIINFTFSGAMTADQQSGYQASGSGLTNAVYYLISDSADVTAAQLIGGTKLSGTSSGDISVAQGKYLYLMMDGFARQHYQDTIGGLISGTSSYSMTYNYTGSFTSFTVQYNEQKWKVNAGFQDNTGAALGSGKITVNDTAQSIGSGGMIAEVEYADKTNMTFQVDAAPSGYTHIGWAVTANGTTKNYYQPTYSTTLTADTTVKALFVPQMTIAMGNGENGYTDATYTLPDGSAPNGQWVARNSDSTAFYTTLADAFSKTDKVVLLASATINGDWTIPSGKTLVIPYKLGDKGNTEPTIGSGTTYDYCRVTMNGNLTVKGALLVNAMQGSQVGHPVSGVGHLVMASGTKITVDGTLYAHGPITGSGTITANSTATVYEYVQVTDSRAAGGDSPLLLSNIFNERGSKKAFFFSAFVPNNIEVSVTYHNGAKLNGHLAINFDKTSRMVLPFISNSSALFTCSSGTITKYFDHATGQVVLRLEEGAVAHTESIAFSAEATLAGQNLPMEGSMDEFIMALASYYRLEVAGDMTLNQSFKLLPGAVIDVKETGRLTLAQNADLIFYRGNDYDTRGLVRGTTTAEEAQGYTNCTYPVNTVHYPGVSYPFAFNVDNMGSAKLNVDGCLVVNGGLYVTNDEQSYSGFVPKANGYNYLTGSGNIDMTNATSNLSSVYEFMRSDKGTNPVWVEVSVVTMMGLYPDAATDAEGNYTALSGVKYGYTNANGLNVWGDNPCAAGHTYANDCDADCDVCGETRTVTHNYTQKNDTINHWDECLCGDTQNVTPHSSTKVTGQAATCTEVGYEAYEYCSACDYTTYKEIPAGHSLVQVEAKEATCTEAGYKAYEYCTECDYTTKVEIPSTHDLTHHDAVAAECEKTGKVECWSCSACSKNFADEDATQELDKVTTDALQHNWIPATFEAPKTCSLCKTTEGAALVPVAQIGETKYETLAAAIAAAEEENTVTLLADITLTEKLTISKKVTLDLNGKTITTAIVDDYAPIYVGVSGELTVTGNGTVISENDIVFGNFGMITIEDGTFCSNAAEYNAALYNMYYNGTTYGKAVINGGTFESPVWNSGVLTVEGGTLNGIDNSGKTVITGGTVNGEITAGDGSDAPELTEKGTIAISGGVFENAVEKTWCAEGYCPATNEDGTYGVHEHKYESVVTAPTCTEAGYTTYTCSACGDNYTADEVAANGHSYSESVTKAATCTEAGEKTFTCSCGDSYTEEIAATGHNMVAGEVVAPTCTADGYTVYTCSNDCGTTENKDTVATTGHTAADPVKENEVAATCTADGSYDSVVYCSVCDAELSREEKTIAATGEHNYATEVEGTRNPATCMATGSVTMACECGATTTREIDVDPNAHKDTDHNHVCDNGCEVFQGEHSDSAEDQDHVCDYCSEAIENGETCVDNNKDHKCDVCGEELTQCADGNNDHNCDTCGGKLTDCGDADTNHKCDICGAVMNTAVAKIGDVYYGSLAEAVDAVAEGGTITLLANVEDEVVINKPVSIVKNGLTANVIAGEGFELTDTDEAYHLAKKADFVYGLANKFGQTHQVILVEPWGLRLNLKVYHLKPDGSKGTQYTEAELAAIEDYGVYVVRESDLNMGDVTQNDITMEDILNNVEKVHYNKTNGRTTIRPSNKDLTSVFNEKLFTYQFSDSLFVMYYIVEDGVTYYAPIRERNMSQIINDGITSTNSNYTEGDRKVFTTMAKLEADLLKRIDDVQQEIPQMNVPTLAENPLSGNVLNSEDYGMKFGHTTNVILVEPWGIRFNGKVKLDKAYDDCGFVVYYDVNGTLASAPSQEELLAIESAYIFSSKNADVETSVETTGQMRTVITAVYNSGLYTYQMEQKAYVMFYVKDGENIYCGPVKERSIRSCIDDRLEVSGVEGTVEGDILHDMIAMYEAVLFKRNEK